jgi:hypothetical protein
MRAPRHLQARRKGESSAEVGRARHSHREEEKWPGPAFAGPSFPCALLARSSTSSQLPPQGVCGARTRHGFNENSCYTTFSSCCCSSRLLSAFTPANRRRQSTARRAWRPRMPAWNARRGSARRRTAGYICERGGFRTMDAVTLHTASLVAPKTAALRQDAEPPASRAVLLAALTPYRG